MTTTRLTGSIDERLTEVKKQAKYSFEQRQKQGLTEMMGKIFNRWHLEAWLVLAFLGCQSKEKEGRARDPRPKMPALQVSASRKLIFVYKNGDRFVTVEQISRVPDWARSAVKVMDPSLTGIPGTWVYMANLCKANAKGLYPYKVVRLETFERTEPKGCQGATLPMGKGSGKVIMYMTTTCPVCTRAEQFLKAKGIPYVTRDVGKDPAAAQELREKASKAGVSATGVPVFDINGKILPGFSPDHILALISKRT